MPLEAEKTRFGCQADLVLVSTRKCRRGYERQEPAEPLQRSYTLCDGSFAVAKVRADFAAKHRSQ